MAFLDHCFQPSGHVASLATGQAHEGEPHDRLVQNDLYGRVAQELFFEENSESGESNTEELNQDGLDLEESANGVRQLKPLETLSFKAREKLPSPRSLKHRMRIQAKK